MSEQASTTLQGAIQGLIDHLKRNASSAEDGRAKSLTITKLEEALMWSEKIWKK